MVLGFFAGKALIIRGWKRKRKAEERERTNGELSESDEAATT